ncbi:hypothetical protein HMPREF3213_02818 [Heyndrickxia coagulans]|uniref:Uncharacterized protein n=1 Tax=Heyndrickxia coagulans TaxID=1398 RepID=A0A133KHH1_HEYCO|nr:hypothetical protein HMPREF3213_02818 [Heyndrickxia coagulans]
MRKLSYLLIGYRPVLGICRFDFVIGKFWEALSYSYIFFLYYRR